METPHLLDTWCGATIRLRALRHQDQDAMEASLQLPEEREENKDRMPPQGVPGKERAHPSALLPNTRKGDDAAWAIETVQGQLVGAIVVAGCHRRRGTFKIALALMRPFRRRGYGREAVHIVLGAYFHWEYQKVTVSVPAYNEPAIRFFEALGFMREGRLRNLLVLDGQHYDKLYYGLTAEEFELFELGEAISTKQRTGGQS